MKEDSSLSCLYSKVPGSHASSQQSTRSTAVSLSWLTIQQLNFGLKLINKHVFSPQAGTLAHICLQKTVRTQYTIYPKSQIKARTILPYWAKLDDLLELFTEEEIGDLILQPASLKRELIPYAQKLEEEIPIEEKKTRYIHKELCHSRR